MKSQLSLHCLLSNAIAPVVAGASLLAGVSPASAVTLASSTASSTLDGFSHSPSFASVRSFTNTLASSGNFQNIDPFNSNVTSPQGSAFAEALADGLFLTEYDPPFSPLALNSAESLAGGEGSNYSALAQATSESFGEFSIAAGEEFSFNFLSDLSLFTRFDPLSPASTHASAEVSLVLLGKTALDTSYSLLDSFSMFGSFSPPSLPDLPDSTDGFSIAFSESFTDSWPNSAGGRDNFFDWFVGGSYQNVFEEDMQLQLVQVTTTVSTVKVKTPEPSSILALLCLGGVFGLARRDRRQACHRRIR